MFNRIYVVMILFLSFSLCAMDDIKEEDEIFRQKLRDYLLEKYPAPHKDLKNLIKAVSKRNKKWIIGLLKRGPSTELLSDAWCLALTDEKDNDDIVVLLANALKKFQKEEREPFTSLSDDNDAVALPTGYMTSLLESFYKS